MEWNTGLRSLFFIISPKHYIWWQLVNWIPQTQLCFWVQTSVYHHPLPSHSRTGQGPADPASSLLLSVPCIHPDQGYCCPSTNTGQNLGLSLLSFSWESFSLGWIFASNCQAAPTALENALLHCLPLSSAKWTLALLNILPDLTLPASPVTGYHPCLTLHMPISAQFSKLILLFHIALTWPTISLSPK